MNLQPSDLLQKLDFSVQRDIISLLSQNNCWKKIAQYFDYSEDTLMSYYLRNPADVLMEHLQSGLCSVGLFCEAVETCQLFSILLLLKKPEPLQILKQPTGSGLESSIMIERGGLLILSCEATGLPPPSYQWFCNNEELLDQNRSEVIISNFDVYNEGQYICELSQEGSENCLFSNVITVSLIPEPPNIITQPSSSETCRIGSTLSLSLEAHGHPQLSYQWYNGNQQLDGFTDNKLIISNISEEHEGQYRCYICNSCGEVWSNPTTVSVYAAPEDFNTEGKPKLEATAKLALLIANQSYTNLCLLNTPGNDVKTLAEILQELGFEILALKDLSLIEMKNAIKYFCDIIPQGAYVIFYYAGHGFQVRDKFMLPVDCPSPEEFLQTDALCERELLRLMLDTSPKVLVELLDMCLKAPDPANKKVFEEPSDLQEYHAKNNLIQGYATTCYRGAYEKKNAKNGLYVKHLQKYLKEDISIVKILDCVAKAIENEKVNEIQIPYRGTNVTNDFKLTDPVIDNSLVHEKLKLISKLPANGIIKFENSDVEAVLTFSPYLDVFLNSLNIEIHNLKSYQLNCYTDSKELKFDLIRHGEGLQLIIDNIQKMKSEKSISLHLLSRTDQKLIGHAVIDLKKPMVGVLDLWCDSSSSLATGVANRL